jgi:hypothetical protein
MANPALLLLTLVSVIANFGDKEGNLDIIAPPTLIETVEAMYAEEVVNAPMWKDIHTPWKIPFPEMCNIKATAKPTNADPLPGQGSKRIALLLRGESYRGLSYGSTVCYKNGQAKPCNKLPFYCTEEAEAIQKATAAAQMKMMVKPWEAAGFEVDIFVSSYGCNGIPGLSDERVAELDKGLVEMYGKNVVASAFYNRTANDGPRRQNQDTGK